MNNIENPFRSVKFEYYYLVENTNRKGLFSNAAFLKKEDADKYAELLFQDYLLEIANS